MRHVDRRHGRRLLRHQSEGLECRRQGGLRARAQHRPRQERQLALGLESRHPRRLEEGRCGGEVHRLGDKQGLHCPRRVEGGLVERTPGYTHLALSESGLSEGGALRQAHARLDRLGRPEPSDGQAGALCRRAIRRHPGIPGDRHGGRPAILGGARRFDLGRRGAGRGPILDRARDEARRLHQVTEQTQRVGRLSLSPAVALLFVWMIVPLGMTIYFSLLHYSLLDPGHESFVGLENYVYFLTDPSFLYSMRNTLLLVGSVLAITIVVGTLIALLLDQAVVGRNIVRLMVIAPFFVMPTVSALVWKNLLMHPVSGLFAYIAISLGLTPIDWFTDAPLLAIILIVSWQWLPFATLILLTALQSLDEEQKEAAEMDGAGALSSFFYITLPHLARPITVVILIETIFLLTVFAEIFVTTGGGPGLATTNIAFLIYLQALIQFDVGTASAGGLVAVVLANIVAFFLVRIVGRNLDA